MSIRQIPITPGSKTPIYYGSLVYLNASGELEAAASGGDAPIGVFGGCSYTDETYGPMYRTSYLGGVTAEDIKAYVRES
jgi:hypothetical protein